MGNLTPEIKLKRYVRNTSKRTMERGLRRLEILEKDILQELDPKTQEFDSVNWGRVLVGCKTIACAAGYAALSPKLPGLIPRSESVLSPVLKADPLGKEGFDALIIYFNLSILYTFEIFDPFTYNIKQGRPALEECIKRIRKIRSKIRKLEKEAFPERYS